VRNVTKIVFLVCLVCVTIVPVVMWAATGGSIDMSGIGAFVAATSGPLGILTGAMAATRIAQTKNGGGKCGSE
jgi:hypothetical protein